MGEVAMPPLEPGGGVWGQGDDLRYGHLDER